MGGAGSVEHALAAGRRALLDSDTLGAIRWLDRAWRLAPGNAQVGTLLAAALIGHDGAQAISVLRALASGDGDVRAAQAGLVAACWRSGLHAEAAAALIALLGRFAPPRGQDFNRLASHVADSVGAPGWVGVDAGGHMTVGLTRFPRDVAWSLGGRGACVSQRRAAVTYRLGVEWMAARSLDVTCAGRTLLGSPVAVPHFRRLEGVVRRQPGALLGCAWFPADPDRTPALTLVQGSVRTSLTLTRRSVLGAPPFACSFRATVGETGETLRVLDPCGKDLYGSPLSGAAQPRPAARARPALRRPRRRASVDVIVPVHGGAADLVQCLESLRRDLPACARVIVVDDASDDSELDAVLAAEAERGTQVIRRSRNGGFARAANAGLRQARRSGRDAVLLNPDTILPAGLIRRLADVAYAAADIGSVTPLTDDDSILGCALARAERAGSAADVDRIDGWFAAANGTAGVDIPTGVGYCMYMRHECLSETGLLEERAFAQGYGEENDWCLRASAGGWRHVAATGVFVSHSGGRSFSGSRHLLMRRNAAVLAELHPGYGATVGAFRRDDPLRLGRRRAAVRKWRAAETPASSVLLVTHDRGGGTERFVAQRCAAIARQGLQPIVLRLAGPQAEPDRCRCAVSDAPETDWPDLAYDLPGELDELAALLAGDRPRALELHHLAGFPPHVLALCRRLSIPYDVYVHDYALVCPRVTFLGRGDTYCGEPEDAASCDRCVAELGNRVHEVLPVAALRARSAVLLAQSAAVNVPCRDVQRRMQRYFPGVKTTLAAWEAPRPRAAVASEAPDPETRVCVVGAIGRDKGYDLLLGCAKDAAERALPLQFIIVGHTIDDGALLATGRAFITGPFREDEAVTLVRAQGARLGLVASVCPETWSYALSTLWRAGLDAATFSIGAPAERIREAGRGWVVPLGAPPAQINRMLLHVAGRAPELAQGVAA